MVEGTDCPNIIIGNAVQSASWSWPSKDESDSSQDSDCGVVPMSSNSSGYREVENVIDIE
jgi:hypothetical protein